MIQEEYLSDEFFMRQALNEAQKAFDKDEVPVGAVIVANNNIIARAHNLTETLNDATAHAEMQVITAAANYLGNKYLNDCKLFVTLEPCFMCAGALFWSQLGKLVYGASDTKRGYRLCQLPVLHPRTEVMSGILGTETELLLKEFFARRRKLEN
jgi:tRNA(adenine34) deaminase